MSRMPQQLSLEPEATHHNLPESFRRLYYHLYTNSKASRAETIIEDLSLLLLAKLAADFSGQRAPFENFLRGGHSRECLLPLLRDSFPHLLTPDQKFALDDASIRIALEQLEHIDLAHAPAHSIGEAFQALMGPRLRGEKGQFFTPKSLVRCMVEVVDPRPGEAVLDPAAGTGGFLAEAYLYQLRKHPKKKPTGGLLGVDKDTGLARLGSALLAVLLKGDRRGEVVNFNSLNATEWMDHFGRTPEGGFDVVLTNPPFGAKIGVKEPEILKAFDLGHIWTKDANDNWLRTAAVSASEDPQILFLELCVRALKPGGRLGIVLPEGMFGNRQSSYIWDWLRERGDVVALLDCPRTTFQPGTDTKTNVLFFRRNKTARAVPTPPTRLAVALNCGHDRRGRSLRPSGEPYPDDFEKIGRDFSASEGTWREVQLSGDYLVPRYHYYREDKASLEPEFATAKIVSLGELVRNKIITIKKGHEVGSDAYGTGDIPFVRTSDISNFEISVDPTKAVSEQLYEEYANQQGLRAGDILMVVDGRYRIGTTAILDEHSVKCVAQSHLRIISVTDKTKLDPYALLYALNLPSVKVHLRGLVFIQSTLGTLGSRLQELRIPLLHTSGSWQAKIARFKTLLQGRAQHLAQLKEMSGPEIEL